VPDAPSPSSRKSIYDVDVDLSNANAHSLALTMIGGGKRVLELGCAGGHVTKVLADRGCAVTGVEQDKEVADGARRYAERVVVGDLESETTWSELEGETFDVLLFGDVLEHTRDPLAVLRRSRSALSPDGFVVLSIPNIAHADVRLALLSGSFEYRPVGLLDSTHLRFFTYKSLLRLLDDAGLAAVEISRVTVPMFATELEVPNEVDPALVAMIRRDPECETYQFVVKAVRDDARRSIATVTTRLRELEEVARDLEAQNERLRRELQERSTASSELARATDELERLKRTRTFRWTAPLRRAYGALRRAD
jgi:2-polyprenyl-3-methyl-5-hydroxy-6-metoxy-1,4-benzoquinol methylase